MIAVVVLFSLLICLITLLTVSAYALFRCESGKRSFFLLFSYSVFLYIIGHILEIMSFDVNGAFTALKLEYTGSIFGAAFFLCFILDYCGVKIKKFIYALLLGLSALITVLFWTNSDTGFIYSAWWWDESKPIYKLAVEHGSLYNIPHIYSFLCIAASVICLIKFLRKWDKSYKKLLYVFLVMSVPLFIGDVIIFFSSETFNPYYVNITPYTMTAVVVISLMILINENIVDVSSSADVQILDTISVAYLLFDSGLKLVDFNKTAKIMFDISKPASINRHINNIGDIPESLVNFISNYSGEDAEFHFTLEREHVVCCDASVSEISDGNGKNIGRIIMMRDVTEKQMLMEKLRETAYRDALTGLFNRRRFMDLAENLFEQRRGKNNSGCFAMIMDIDFFKKVNDTYGHLAGDEVLRSVSGRIKNAVRECDLLARYGGEEFVVFIDKGELSDVIKVAERIRADVEAGSCTYDETVIKNTISIGVAVCEQHNLKIDELLKSADDALYKAKKDGRNRVVLLK